MDWAQPVEFLDTQLQQITKEAEVGRRFADLLVKVMLLDGDEAWLCLHVEVQAQKDLLFPERLFIYNARIFELFRKPAISLAILADTNSKWRPTHFGFDYPATSLHFRFSIAKLLDYNHRLDELAASNNPFSVVVMAHLQAQATRKNDQKRKGVKFTLAKRLYESGYQRQDVINLFRFIDWTIILPKTLDQEFWQALRDFEEQKNMPYITSVERIGIEKGEQIGIEKGEQIGFERGLQEGKRALILHQLTHGVGELPADLSAQISALPLAQLEALGEALLDFTSLADLQAWLSR